MNADLTRLIESIRRTLSEVIAPELDSDFARSQLAAAHDILGKLSGMVVWDPASLQEQAQVLQAGARHFAEQLKSWGLVLPKGLSPSGESLAAAEAHVRALTDWLDTVPASLTAQQVDDLDAILRQTMREQLRVERKRIPLTDFNAMTTAQSKT